MAATSAARFEHSVRRSQLPESGSVRVGVCTWDPELEVVGEAGSVGEAMVKIPALRPDVAVLDVRLPDGNGIELCRDLLSDLPDLFCLMLTSYTSDEAMLDAILAGASGYVVNDIEGMELAQAIKDVGAGKSLLDNRAAAALMAKLRGAAERKDPLSGLTDHERTLLGLSMDRSGIRVSRGLVTTGHQPPGRLALGSRGQPQDDGRESRSVASDDGGRTNGQR